MWLIIYGKKSTTESVNYADAVEEALCFGWIDSKGNKRDEQSYYQFFALRNPKSSWSKLNKERVQQLTEQGLMMPAGQKMIDVAKASGAWEALTDVQNEVVPDDLKKLFKKNKTALKNFEAFSPSSKRIILEWISNAKKPETRLQRIKQTVELAEKNIRANHYRQ